MTTSDAELWWSSPSFWRKTAIWVTAVSLVALIFLTFDTMSQIAAGSRRVPDYTAINKSVSYVFDDKRRVQVPVLGGDEPLFGKMLSAAEAEALVTQGKLTVQAKNCMECHTLLGNGAYYAPDLTKAWLDPAWTAFGKDRDRQLVNFLRNPSQVARNVLQRKMPNLGITEEEARAVVAFLKWMSTIDTNGFPYNFPVQKQERSS